LWLAGAAGVLAPSAVVAENGVCSFHADVLGTQANFMVAAPTREAAQIAVGTALFEIARLDLILSNYRPDSELRRLNAARQMRVSQDLFAVLSHAEDLHRRSGGAFNARLGALEALWRAADTALPEADAMRRAVEGAQQAPLLNPADRCVLRPEGVVFAADGLAKGYIVDRALDAARGTGLSAGIMIDIGGDLRCQGRAGGGQDWQVGLSDPRLPYANAPLIAEVKLKNQAIATSGRGVRDRIIGGAAYGTTLSPREGMPVTAQLTASVVASTAAEADGLATALLVMPPEQGLLLAAQSGAQARITQADGTVLTTAGWMFLEAAASPPPRAGTAGVVRIAGTETPVLRPSGWVIDWALQIEYEARIDLEHRPSDYRSPYLAMWISDKAGHPLRTLLVIGKDPEYQKDNHIWWSLYGTRARNVMDVRSGPTSLSGRYPSFWPGIDDSYASVAPGDFLLNIETSRERGAHTFRSVPVAIGHKAFAIDIKPTADMGAIRLAFGRRP
jgi:thiamine biosynthesis lipoprotein